jgi:hypothetical protein
VTHQTDFQKPSMAEIHLMQISATAEIKIKLPRKIIIHLTRKREVTQHFENQFLHHKKLATKCWVGFTDWLGFTLVDFAPEAG